MDQIFGALSSKCGLFAGIFMSILVLSVSSCKKCVVCSNVCYQCTNTLDSICSSDFASPAVFQTVLSQIEATGSTCSVISSSKSYDVCDKPSTVKNFETYYEGLGYTCANK